MARPATERLVQHQIQTRVPRVPQRRRRAPARRVMSARLAGSANGPAPVDARATAGIARAATLVDAWKAGIAAPAHHTADPTAAGATGGPSARTCDADLRRRMRAHRTGEPPALGLDASQRRADSCACASARAARACRSPPP